MGNCIVTTKTTPLNQAGRQPLRRLNFSFLTESESLRHAPRQETIILLVKSSVKAFKQGPPGDAAVQITSRAESGEPLLCLGCRPFTGGTSSSQKFWDWFQLLRQIRTAWPTALRQCPLGCACRSRSMLVALLFFAKRPHRSSLSLTNNRASRTRHIS
jgi:hypothetical protein